MSFQNRKFIKGKPEKQQIILVKKEQLIWPDVSQKKEIHCEPYELYDEYDEYDEYDAYDEDDDF